MTGAGGEPDAVGSQSIGCTWISTSPGWGTGTGTVHTVSAVSGPGASSRARRRPIAVVAWASLKASSTSSVHQGPLEGREAGFEAALPVEPSRWAQLTVLTVLG
jgi:hypothetical protein